jgi:hypothetical protein
MHGDKILLQAGSFCIFKDLRLKGAFDQLRLRKTIGKEFVYGTYVEILAVKFCLFPKN